MTICGFHTLRFQPAHDSPFISLIIMSFSLQFLSFGVLEKFLLPAVHQDPEVGHGGAHVDEDLADDVIVPWALPGGRQVVSQLQ